MSYTKRVLHRSLRSLPWARPFLLSPAFAAFGRHQSTATYRTGTDCGG